MTTNDRNRERGDEGPGNDAMRMTAAEGAPAEAADERGLVDRLRRGDPEAAADFYDRYAARVSRFIMSSLGAAATPEDAEDLSQETFIAMAEALPFFRGDSSLMTFACAIAHRKTMSFLRTGARRAQIMRSRPAEVPAPDAAPPADQALRRAMARLKPEYREVLHLKYVEEASTAEIAAIVRKSGRAVESTLARARRAMRKLLEAER